MSVLTTAQLDAMRATITGLLPDLVTNETTEVTTTCWLEADNREHSLPGAPSEVRQRRWRIEQPAGTVVARGDLLDVAGMGKYWVVEVLNPQSYSVQVISLCYLVLDSDGTTVSAVAPNATVLCTRAGTQVGTARRVRLEHSPPGAVTPAGERLPDLLWADPEQDWLLSDVCTVQSIDGFSGPGHPTRFRVGAVQEVSDELPVLRVELRGEGGGWEA